MPAAPMHSANRRRRSRYSASSIDTEALQLLLVELDAQAGAVERQQGPALSLERLADDVIGVVRPAYLERLEAGRCADRGHPGQRDRGRGHGQVNVRSLAEAPL